MREFIQFPREGQTPREATIGWRNLKRTYRAAQQSERYELSSTAC